MACSLELPIICGHVVLPEACRCVLHPCAFHVFNFLYSLGTNRGLHSAHSRPCLVLASPLDNLPFYTRHQDVLLLSLQQPKKMAGLGGFGDGGPQISQVYNFWKGVAHRDAGHATSTASASPAFAGRAANIAEAHGMAFVNNILTSDAEAFRADCFTRRISTALSRGLESLYVVTCIMYVF